MDRGELVPDDVMLGLIEERLGMDDAVNGFILDGYPRNLAQAEALEALLGRLGLPVDEAVLIDVAEDEVVGRRGWRLGIGDRGLLLATGGNQSIAGCRRPAGLQLETLLEVR